MMKRWPPQPFAVYPPPEPMFQVSLNRHNEIVARPILMLLQIARGAYTHEEHYPEMHMSFDYEYALDFHGGTPSWLTLFSNHNDKRLNEYYGEDRRYLGIHNGAWDAEKWVESAVKRLEAIMRIEQRREKAKEYNRRRKEKAQAESRSRELS